MATASESSRIGEVGRDAPDDAQRHLARYPTAYCMNSQCETRGISNGSFAVAKVRPLSSIKHFWKSAPEQMFLSSIGHMRVLVTMLDEGTDLVQKSNDAKFLERGLLQRLWARLNLLHARGILCCRAHLNMACSLIRQICSCAAERSSIRTDQVCIG